MYIKHIARYSYLRVAACFAIVLLHICNAAEILYRDQITLTEQTAALSVVSCMMWAVPCFVMVSGSLLLNPVREVSLQKIYQKYILRMVLALMICCILFRGFDMVMNREPFSLFFITDGLWKMITAGSWAHLWYLYLLIGIYILLPFYRKAAKHSSDAELRYLLIVYALFLSVLQITRLAGVQMGFYIHVSTIYPFYLFGGYVIARRKTRLPAAAIIAMVGIGITGLVLFTCVRQIRQIEAMDCLVNYSSVFTVLLSCGIFSLFCSGVETCEESQEEHTVDHGRNKIFSGFVESIDQNSFGIYLFHMILVRLILRYWEFNPFHYGAWMFLVLAVMIFFATYVCVWLLRKIPLLRKII